MSGLFLRTVPLLAVMGTVFLLSHQPVSAFYELPFAGADKLVHMGVYGVMAATALFAFPDVYRVQRRKTAMMATVLFCFAYGISDELHQSFVPGRDASVGDIAADTVGALITAVGWFMTSRAGTEAKSGGSRA